MTVSGFVQNAEKYAQYLGTIEGRLRLDLTLAGMREFLPLAIAAKPRRALDVGGGTAAAAIHLAGLNFDVTLLDHSDSMLAMAQRAACEAGVDERISFRRGDASDLRHMFQGEMFDVVLCHNLLEYVDDPHSAVQACAQLMKGDSASLLSVLTRNRWGEVLKSALRSHDLGTAERMLEAEWATESLYGGDVRLFSPHEIVEMMQQATLSMIAQRGVRVLADYLPEQLLRGDQYKQLFELELKLGGRAEFSSIARYTHSFCAKADPRT